MWWALKLGGKKCLSCFVMTKKSLDVRLKSEFYKFKAEMFWDSRKFMIKIVLLRDETHDEMKENHSVVELKPKCCTIWAVKFKVAT